MRSPRYLFSIHQSRRQPQACGSARSDGQERHRSKPCTNAPQLGEEPQVPSLGTVPPLPCNQRCRGGCHRPGATPSPRRGHCDVPLEQLPGWRRAGGGDASTPACSPRCGLQHHAQERKKGGTCRDTKMLLLRSDRQNESGKGPTKLCSLTVGPHESCL